MPPPPPPAGDSASGVPPLDAPPAEDDGWFHATAAEHVHKDCTCGPKGGNRATCPARLIANAIHRHELIKVAGNPIVRKDPPNSIVRKDPPPPDGRSEAAKSASEIARLQALDRGGVAASSAQARDRAIADNASAEALKKFKGHLEIARACPASRDEVVENDGICKTCALGIEFAKHHRHKEMQSQSPRRTGAIVVDGESDVDSPVSKRRAVGEPNPLFALGPLGLGETPEAAYRARMDAWRDRWTDGTPRSVVAWAYLRSSSFGDVSAVMYQGFVIPPGAPSLSTVFRFSAKFDPTGNAETDLAISMARSTFRSRLVLGARAIKDIILGFARRRRADWNGTPEKFVQVLTGAASVTPAFLHVWNSILDPQLDLEEDGSCELPSYQLSSGVPADRALWWLLMYHALPVRSRVSQFDDLLRQHEAILLGRMRLELTSYGSWKADSDKAIRDAAVAAAMLGRRVAGVAAAPDVYTADAPVGVPSGLSRKEQKRQAWLEKVRGRKPGAKDGGGAAASDGKGAGAPGGGAGGGGTSGGGGGAGGGGGGGGRRGGRGERAGRGRG